MHETAVLARAAKWASAKPWKLIRFRSMICVSWDEGYSKLGLYKALLRQGIGNAQLGHFG